MFNLLNKSVKTINNGISTLISNMTSESNYKTDIDLVLFANLNLNLLKLNDIKEIENNSSDCEFYFKDYNVLYIIYSKCYLNIYYLDDDLEFPCFFNQKFNFPLEKIGSVYISFNSICSDKMPLIGLVTNKDFNIDAFENNNYNNKTDNRDYHNNKGNKNPHLINNLRIHPIQGI